MDSIELLKLKEMLGKKHSNKIPEPGFHVAKVVGATTEPNSLGTGSVLKLKLEIMEGIDKGVIIKDSINIFHNDAYTQKKGLSWFYYFNNACGFEHDNFPSDLDDYVGKIIKIELSKEKGKAFEVVRYEPATPDGSIFSKLRELFPKRKN